MEEQRDPKKVLEGKPGEQRRDGSHVQGGLMMLKMIFGKFESKDGD
jgi:hypothetical protein